MFTLIFLAVGGAGAYLLWKKKFAAAPGGAPGAPDKAPPTGPSGTPGTPGPHEPPPTPHPALGGGGDGPPAPPSEGAPSFDLHFPGGSAYANNPVYIRAYQGALAYLAQAMNQPTFDPGAITGTLTAQTKTAVMAFQRANHLTADGLAGTMTASALQKAFASVTHTGQMGVECQGEWIALGANLEHAPASLGALIVEAMPYLAVHPMTPPPGEQFATSLGGVLVLFHALGPGQVVPVAYCASLAQAGWMIPAAAHAGWKHSDDRSHAHAGWKHSDDRSRRGR